MSDDGWFVGSYADRYGGAFLSSTGHASPAAAGHMSELPKIGAVPTGHPLDGLKPGSGMFAFALIAAVTVGLAGFATTVRVGPAKASVSAGTT